MTEIHLIDPYAPPDVELVLEAVRGIITGERTPDAALIGPQRYLVKEPWRGEAGYRGTLERRLAERLGVDGDAWRVLAVTSGTAALRLAARALLPPPGGDRREVLMPAVTVANTAEALVAEGYTPVLVDVDPDTWLVDLASAQRALSPRTVGLVSVDWLGTAVDPDAVERFCRDHDLAWISDSAQSFGVTRGTGSVLRAGATVYSTGYPKVFHTGGRGGVLIVPRAVAAALERDPGGVLRNEPLPELAALLGLALLPGFDALLAERRELGACYRQQLDPAHGFTVQRVGAPEHTNCYQLSVRVDPARAGWTAAEMVAHLAGLGVQASAERMPCLDLHPHLRGAVATPVPLPVSRALAASSITLPMPRGLDLARCAWICDVLRARGQRGMASALRPGGEPRAATADSLIHGIAGARYWSIEDGPIPYRTGDGARHTAQRVLAPPAVMRRERIAIRDVTAALARLVRTRPLRIGQAVVAPLGIRAILPAGDLVLDEPSPHDEIAACPESGSSARVALCLDAGGRLTVRKRCAHDGIDGNGRPWLERQFHYLNTREFEGLGDLFVKPTALDVEDGETVVSLPYLASMTLTEHLLAGGDEEFAIGLLGAVCAQLARRAWTASMVDSSGRYLSDAHLARMRRRLDIAARAHPELRDALALDEIDLDGERLMGFTRTCERLAGAGLWTRLEPRRLGLIHGDLNLYNVLCLREPTDGHRFKLIDPRGTPLWDATSSHHGPERGDYVYDLAKIKFSLGGFVAIRAGLVRLERRGPREFGLIDTGDHLGLRSLARCDARFNELCERLPAIAEARARIGDTTEVMTARLELAEAADFIADAACALGRDCAHEVLPLFLTGLRKLNHVHARWCRAERPRPGRITPSAVARRPSPIVGLDAIRDGIAAMAERPPWDLIEIVVPRDAAPLAARVAARARGVYLPPQASIHVTHHPCPGPGPGPGAGPHVLVHAVDPGLGQLAALATAMTRTRTFLAMLAGSRIDPARQRILTVLPGREPADHLLCRAGAPLLAAGPSDRAPLLLLLAASYQLAGAPPGRWVITGDALPLCAGAVAVTGDCLAVLPGPAWYFVPHALTGAIEAEPAPRDRTLAELERRTPAVERVATEAEVLTQPIGSADDLERLFTGRAGSHHWRTFLGLPLALAARPVPGAPAHHRASTGTDA